MVTRKAWDIPANGRATVSNFRFALTAARRLKLDCAVKGRFRRLVFPADDISVFSVKRAGSRSEHCSCTKPAICAPLSTFVLLVAVEPGVLHLAIDFDSEQAADIDLLKYVFVVLSACSCVTFHFEHGLGGTCAAAESFCGWKCRCVSRAHSHLRACIDPAVLSGAMAMLLSWETAPDTWWTNMLRHGTITSKSPTSPPPEGAFLIVRLTHQAPMWMESRLGEARAAVCLRTRPLTKPPAGSSCVCSVSSITLMLLLWEVTASSGRRLVDLYVPLRTAVLSRL